MANAICVFKSITNLGHIHQMGAFRVSILKVKLKHKAGHLRFLSSFTIATKQKSQRLILHTTDVITNMESSQTGKGPVSQA